MTHFARSANFRVDMVSSMDSINGETVAIKYVWVFPPIESCSNLVSLDSLKGMCPGVAKEAKVLLD
jgi:hypothetical protein